MSLPQNAPAETASTLASYYRRIRPEIQLMVPASARRVLDVGCGAGSLGFALKRDRVVEVHGIELESPAAELARGCLDFVWNATIEDALPSVQDCHYDCIVLADVLEHLRDPWDVLRRLKPKLASGGVFAVSIPNIQNWDVVSSLLAGRFAYESEGILDWTHVRFFTRRSVEELFWSAGLRIDTIGATTSEKKVPEKFFQLCRSAGLDGSSLQKDGQSYQFLVRASAPEMETPKVVAVVLNWNGKDDSLACLESLQHVRYKNLEVVVVDNGSSDDSVMAIRTSFPQIHLIEASANLGYSGGNNLGIEYALGGSAAFILLLNNDTVVDPSFLDHLVLAATATPDFGFFSPQIRFHSKPNNVWYSGAEWDCAQSRTTHTFFGREVDKCPTQPFETGYASGCALLARRQALLEVGSFDDRFFLTFEESDLCYRGRERSGWRSMVVPAAVVFHKVSVSFGGATSPMASYYMTRNRLLWAQKHLSRSDFFRALRTVVAELVPRVPELRRGGTSVVKGFYWALTEYARAWRQQWWSAQFRARLRGLRDFALRRFGARLAAAGQRGAPPPP